MKKVAIVGLGWLGMPLAMALSARGWQVTGSKTTPDGVEAARRCGLDAFQLELTPDLICDAEDLDVLFDVDALVVTLPASRTAEGGDAYVQAVQNVVDTALAHSVPRIIFTSSTSVYGGSSGSKRKKACCSRKPQRAKRWWIWKTGCTICPVPAWMFCVWRGWWGLSVIRDVFWPVSRRYPTVPTGSIWFTLMMWWKRSCCCCKRPGRPDL